MQYAMLIAPSSNRVYAGAAPALAAAELAVCTGLESVRPITLAGIDYLGFETGALDAQRLASIAAQSTCWALFAREGDALHPVPVPRTDLLDDDLVTIPKYQGKTNEQFTRLLLNVTAAGVECPRTRRWAVLDPMCGRGTTLSLALTAGMDAAGVEADPKAVEAMAAFWRTWLRRKRLKHSADINPVRRDGKSLGKRFDVTVRLPQAEELSMSVFTGDARASAALFGKRRFEAIVTDAPYGVVHASRTASRDRSPAALLAEAIPVWAGQLKPGGALGISWNTFGLAREGLAEFMTDAGLRVRDHGPWREFAHRVDSSINRDLMVATRPV